MTPTVEQARVARQRWDEICEDTARTLRRYKPLAEERGDHWFVPLLESMAVRAIFVKDLANGRRAVPGETPTGFKDLPPAVDQPPYEEVGVALTRLIRYYDNGLGLSDWDWGQGFPSTWPTTWKDRWKAYLPTVQKNP